MPNALPTLISTKYYKSSNSNHFIVCALTNKKIEMQIIEFFISLCQVGFEKQIQQLDNRNVHNSLER